MCLAFEDNTRKPGKAQMTSSSGIAAAPKTLQGLSHFESCGLLSHQHHFSWEQTALFQGKGPAVQRPRAVLASSTDLQSEARSGTKLTPRRGAEQAGSRRSSPGVNGGADRSDARSAAKQILERLDNGLADAIDGGANNGGHRAGVRNGKSAFVGKRNSGAPPGRQVRHTEAGSGVRKKSATPSYSLAASELVDWTAGSSSDTELATGTPVSEEPIGRPPSSGERRTAKRAGKKPGNPGAAGFSSLGGATAANPKPSSAAPNAHLAANSKGPVSDSPNAAPGTKLAWRSPLPSIIQQAPRSVQPEARSVAVADISRAEQGAEASSSGAAHHRDVPMVGTLHADVSPPLRSAGGRPPRSGTTVPKISPLQVNRYPPRRTVQEPPPRWVYVPKSARARRRKLWEQKSRMWKAKGREPLVAQVVTAVQGVSPKGLEITTAVEGAVAAETLAQMDVEKWKEVLRLLGKGEHCLHMEAVLEYMRGEGGCGPDAETFSRVFFALHRNRHYERALRVFQLLRESGLTGATNVYNCGMSVITKLGGNVPLVEEVFEEMRERGIPRDKFTYSTVMDAVWQAGIRIVRGRKDKVREATPVERRAAADKVEDLYWRMVEEGLVPDTVAKNVVLNALVCSEAYARAELMFTDMCSDARVPPNDRTFTMMMHMYSEQREQEKAQDVFNRMLAAGIPPTEITYNVLIRACVRTRNVREAIRLYREMGTRGLTRSSITLNSLVEVLARSGYFSQAEQVIYGMEIKGFEPSPEPYNMLITGLIRSRECLIDEAMRIFQAMQLARVKPWALTFGALMEGFGRTGRLQEMESMYRRMRYAKLQPTTTIYTAMIHAYVRADDLETSWELFAKMREVGLVPNVQTYTVLIKGLASRGELDVIDDVFAEAKEELLELDGVIYEAVILAHVEGKSLPTAERLCQEMAREGMVMNHKTYDKLAALHTEAKRYDKAEEIWAEKRAVYPDWEEKKRIKAFASGWLWEKEEGGETKRRRPLVLDDVWAALDGPDELDEGSASDEGSDSDGSDSDYEEEEYIL